MKKFTLLALFILINFVAIGQTLSGADKQTVNISGSNTAVTLDTFAKFYNPLKTVYGNTVTGDSTVYFQSVLINNFEFDNITTSRDSKLKSNSDLIYNKVLSEDFKSVRIDSTRITNTTGYTFQNFVKTKPFSVHFEIDETKPWRFRNGEAWVDTTANYYNERSIKSKDYALQIETWTNADTIIIDVIDSNRKIYVAVGDSIYYLVQTTFIANIAKYKIPIPYFNGEYRLVTIGMSDSRMYRLAIRDEYKMYKPDYEISKTFGLVTDSYGVGQGLITHIELLQLSNKNIDIYVNATGGDGYEDFSQELRKHSSRGINDIMIMGGFNDFAVSEAILNGYLDSFLDSCTSLNVTPLIFTPFMSSDTQSYKNGVEKVYKAVAIKLKNYIVFNANSIDFGFREDSIHPSQNGYFDLHKGLKHAFNNQKIDKPYSGLIDLSYIPTSSTDLQLEALTAPINSEWLLLDGATYYRILKVSTTSLHRFAYASF